MNSWKPKFWKKGGAVSMRVPLIIFCLLVAVIPAMIQSSIFIGSVRREQISDRMIEMKTRDSS